MKTSVIALVVALIFSNTPMMAQSFDLGSLTPTLDFPEPSPEPVTKEDSGIDK